MEPARIAGIRPHRPIRSIRRAAGATTVVVVLVGALMAGFAGPAAGSRAQGPPRPPSPSLPAPTQEPGVATPPSAPLPFTPPVVIVYGDSIVHAAGPALEAMLAAHGVSLVDASVGGTSPCDALQFVQGDMQKYDPALVVIAYVGNAFSPCINGTPDEFVLLRHYQDTQRLVEAVQHRPVLLATPPGSIGEGLYTDYDVLVRTEAAMFGAHIAYTARALLDPATQAFEKTVPCPSGPTCPPIVVRGLDNYHLTDAGGYLYAQVLAKAVLARLAAQRQAAAKGRSGPAKKSGKAKKSGNGPSAGKGRSAGKGPSAGKGSV